MSQDRFDGVLVALDNVEHAVGQTGLAQQFGDHHRRRRVDRRRLQDERVSARDGDRIHPGRYHDGEVERRDAGDDAQRLTEGPVVDAGRNLIGIVAFEQLRDAAGELDDVDPALDLAAGIADYFTVLSGDGAREFFLVLVEQGQKAVHDPRPADRRGIGPSWEGDPSGLDRSGDVGGIRQSDLAGNGSRCRVEHVLRSAAGDGNAPAGDDVRDGGAGFGRGMQGAVHGARSRAGGGTRGRDGGLATSKVEAGP